MATDYRQVLVELRAEEKRLIEELEIIRGTIPGVELMAKRMTSVPPSAPVFQRKTDVASNAASSLTFSGMGTRDAIIHLLSHSRVPLMPSDITRLLLEGGIQTRASDFAGTVGSTLTQMRLNSLIERKDEGWVIKRPRDLSSSALQQPSLQ